MGPPPTTDFLCGHQWAGGGHPSGCRMGMGPTWQMPLDLSCLCRGFSYKFPGKAGGDRSSSLSAN